MNWSYPTTFPQLLCINGGQPVNTLVRLPSSCLPEWPHSCIVTRILCMYAEVVLNDDVHCPIVVRAGGLCYAGHWAVRRPRLAVQRAVQALMMLLGWHHIKGGTVGATDGTPETRREDHTQFTNNTHFGVLFLVLVIPKKDLSCGQCNQRNLNIIICLSYTTFTLIGIVVSIPFTTFLFFVTNFCMMSKKVFWKYQPIGDEH